MIKVKGIFMTEEDKKIIGNKKHLYDETVEYDESHLDYRVKEYIDELKKFDEAKDWLSYDLKFDEFEVALRAGIRKKIITEYDYKMLVAKYGWLYD